jgi:predicted RND superfamily exporter protein
MITVLWNVLDKSVVNVIAKIDSHGRNNDHLTIYQLVSREIKTQVRPPLMSFGLSSSTQSKYIASAIFARAIATTGTTSTTSTTIMRAILITTIAALRLFAYTTATEHPILALIAFAVAVYFVLGVMDRLIHGGLRIWARHTFPVLWRR